MRETNGFDDFKDLKRAFTKKEIININLSLKILKIYILLCYF